MSLYTIGYTRKSLRRTAELLREAEVDAIVDVRLRNTGQLAGWAKRDDLAFILELLGIAYVHRLDAAPTDELLDRYRRDHDWAAYEAEYRQLVRDRDILPAVARVLEGYRNPCLLCSEHEPTQCHRRLLAEELVTLRPDVSVVHLR